MVRHELKIIRVRGPVTILRYMELCERVKCAPGAAYMITASDAEAEPQYLKMKLLRIKVSKICFFNSHIKSKFMI